MLFTKNRCGIILISSAGLLALLIFTRCNKLKTKDPIVFSITAHMPNTSTPVPGVRYRIVEMRYKQKFGNPFGESKPTGWELTGVTDAQGKASGSFKGVLKGNYQYYIYFDYSDIVVPSGIASVSINGPQYDLLDRSSPSDNIYDVRILPYTAYHFKVENVNCFDENDKMRFKTYNFDDRPNDDFQYIPFGDYFEGCGLKGEVTNHHVIGGRQVYMMELTRNGQVTTWIDTFNLVPNVVNEVFIQY